MPFTYVFYFWVTSDAAGTGVMDEGRRGCPLRRGRKTGTGRGLLALRRDPVSFSGKETGKRNRQREPIPKAVPFGILPHRPGGCGPLEIPWGLRRTKDGGRKTEDGSLDAERIATANARIGFAMTKDVGREMRKKTAPPLCFASPVHPPFSLDNPAPLCYHLLSSI